MCAWPVWLSVEIGRYMSAQRAIEVLESTECKVSKAAKLVLGRVIFAQELRTIRLVCITVAELGLEDEAGATTQQVYEAAFARGFELCPAEIAVALREQYRESQLEWRSIAMQPAMGFEGLSVLTVDRDLIGFCLRTFGGEPDFKHGTWNKWVFALPDQSTTSQARGPLMDCGYFA